jgi:hypothetical protein
MTISPHRRGEIIDALRRGTVPRFGLDALAVGIERFAPTLDQELDAVAIGRGGFKAVRGDYGSGKTFFGRWVQERARAKGFATSEVQISETETPLHRLETVYRRLSERLATADTPERALRHIIDSWFYTMEEDLLAEGGARAEDTRTLMVRTKKKWKSGSPTSLGQPPPFQPRFALIARH